MRKLCHKTRLFWLLQLTSAVLLFLATLPQGNAEQVKIPEEPQLRLEIASNKLKSANLTTQVVLTNCSTNAIDLVQYSLVVREKHRRAVKVCYQNTAREIVGLALEEPADLAALIGTETLHIGTVGTFTLILKHSKDTSNIELIFFIEDAQRKTVSNSVSVPWRVKRFWTLPTVLIGVGLIFATVLMIILRCSTNPANKHYSLHSPSTSMQSCLTQKEHIVNFIRPEEILKTLIKIKSAKNAATQLNMLKELMNTQDTKKRLEKIQEQIGKDPTLDALLNHWRMVKAVTWLPIWGTSKKIQQIIQNRDLGGLLAKLLNKYYQHISPETLEKAMQLLPPERQRSVRLHTRKA